MLNAGENQMYQLLGSTFKPIDKPIPKTTSFNRCAHSINSMANIWLVSCMSFWSTFLQSFEHRFSFFWINLRNKFLCLLERKRFVKIMLSWRLNGHSSDTNWTSSAENVVRENYLTLRGYEWEENCHIEWILIKLFMFFSFQWLAARKWKGREAVEKNPWKSQLHLLNIE